MEKAMPAVAIGPGVAACGGYSEGLGGAALQASIFELGTLGVALDLRASAAVASFSASRDGLVAAA
jgi:hypothetical protein